MKSWKIVGLGMVGAFLGMMVFTGVSWFYQDVFTVDRSGTIDFRVSATGSIGIGMQGALDTPGSRLVVKASGTGTTSSALDVQASNGASRLFVRDDGNIGIGTTSPELTAHVNGQGIRLTNTVATTQKYGLGFFNSSDFTIYDATSGTSRVFVQSTTGNVGVGTISPDSILELGGTDAAMSLNENSATPASPASGAEARIYMKADKLVIQYNDGGTVRYKYLDLTGTGVTWTHTTTAP